MKTLKLSRNKESASLLLFFISKSPGSCAIYCRNARVLEMQNFTPGLHEGVDVRTDVLRTDDFLRSKISWMYSLPNFLTYGAPLRARERRYYIFKRLFFIAGPQSSLPNAVKLKFSTFVFRSTKGTTHATIQSLAIYVLITLFTFQKFFPHCFRLLSILQRYQFFLPCPATFTVNFSYYLAL